MRRVLSRRSQPTHFAGDVLHTRGQEVAGERITATGEDHSIVDAARESVESSYEHGPVRRRKRHGPDLTWGQTAWLLLQLVAVGLVLGLVLGIIITWGSVTVVQVNR